MRAAAVATLLVIAVAGTVRAGILDSLAVEATAPENRAVKPGLKRLAAPVGATCSADCAAVARGIVAVEQSAKRRSFDLKLKPARSDLAADEAATLRPRLSVKATKRLQRALDHRGTSAVVAFEVSATDDAENQGEDTAETTLEPGFGLLQEKVRTRLAFFDAKRKPTLRFRFRAPAPAKIRVELRRGSRGRPVRAWKLADAKPFARRSVRWDGLDRGGDAAKDGRYFFHVGEAGSRLRKAGGFRWRGHVFPVRGRHGTRGSIGEFGVGRNGGRTHEGFDITGPCGTRLVAARGGKVVRRGFDPVLYGWFVDIRARKSGRRLFYSHLRVAPPVERGDRVKTGQRVGEIGQTGNAKSTPCHLHFEIRNNGKPIDPAPELRKWDRWS